MEVPDYSVGRLSILRRFSKILTNDREDRHGIFSACYVEFASWSHLMRLSEDPIHLFSLPPCFGVTPLGQSSLVNWFLQFLAQRLLLVEDMKLSRCFEWYPLYHCSHWSSVRIYLSVVCTSEDAKQTASD